MTNPNMPGPAVDPQRLERLVDAALRSAPPLAAPAHLESRVRAQLARRAARPWWLRGFSHWPVAAQWLFAPLSLAFLKLATLVFGAAEGAATVARHSAIVQGAQQRWQSLNELARTAHSLGSLVARDIPHSWLYGAAGGALLVYGALFALGALALRALVLPPQNLRY